MKKISVVIILMFINLMAVFAQKQRVLNLPTYDEKPYHFGFLLGVNSTNFHINYTTQIKQYDTIMAVTTKPQGGFNLGIVTDGRIGHYFNVRFVPQLVFSERNVIYTIRDSSNAYYSINKPVESTFLNFPIDLKYRSMRYNNSAVYVVTGAMYSLDMATNKRAKDSGDENMIKMKRHSYWCAIGVGMDFYTTYFKFSPEIRYNIGLNNVLVKDGGPYSSSVDKLFHKAWQISFTFE